MLYDISQIEGSAIEQDSSNEALSLVGDVFWEINPLITAVSCMRPFGIQADEILRAQKLIKAVREFWDGTRDQKDLIFIVDAIFVAYPYFVPWIKSYLKDGKSGRSRFLVLMQYAHRMLYQ